MNDNPTPACNQKSDDYVEILKLINKKIFTVLHNFFILTFVIFNLTKALSISFLTSSTNFDSSLADIMASKEYFCMCGSTLAG